jgi:uncharacterized membrane protein YidH (DUF202 family)
MSVPGSVPVLVQSESGRLDAERTALAWVRTSLAFLGFALIGYRTNVAPQWLVGLVGLIGVGSMVRAMAY